MVAATPQADAQAPVRKPPLDGLRVLDLTRLLPGPLATQHLADFGAEVIKIEDPGGGDYARSLGAGPQTGGDSYFFQLVNRNKKSLVLDLKQDAGREIFLALVRDAALVVEGFRPGVMERLGLGYEVLAAVNPALVLTRISGYGQHGPYAQRAGHDINYLGYAGVLDQIGMAGQAPALSNLQIGDLLGGTLSALSASLIALLEARSTGRGREVDVAMTDATLAHSIFPWVQVLAGGQARARGEDLLSGGVPCYGVYAARDGKFLAVGALEEKFWHRLCDALGCPELRPYGLATGAQAAVVRESLTRIFSRRDRDEWVTLFAEVDCCVTPVLRPEETRHDPHLRARAMWRQTEGLDHCAPFARMQPEFALASRAAPAAGADSEAVLSALGLGRAEIDRLMAAGVVAQAPRADTDSL